MDCKMGQEQRGMVTTEIMEGQASEDVSPSLQGFDTQGGGAQALYILHEPQDTAGKVQRELVACLACLMLEWRIDG